MASAIHFSSRYLRDLDAALDNFRLVSARAAEEFAEEHDRKVALIAESPRIGPVRPGGRRSTPIGTSGYRIIFRAGAATVTLVRLENVRRLRQR
jgi:plasmid stabilization system protein ParE